MSKTWASGSTTRWRKIRATVLDRDGHRCQLRLPGCTTDATHAHHTSPREAVGDNPLHLVAACEHCNLSYGAPTTKDPAPRRPSWL